MKYYKISKKIVALVLAMVVVTSTTLFSYERVQGADIGVTYSAYEALWSVFASLGFSITSTQESGCVDEIEQTFDMWCMQNFGTTNGKEIGQQLKDLPSQIVDGCVTIGNDLWDALKEFVSYKDLNIKGIMSTKFGTLTKQQVCNLLGVTNVHSDSFEEVCSVCSQTQFMIIQKRANYIYIGTPLIRSSGVPQQIERVKYDNGRYYAYTASDSTKNFSGFCFTLNEGTLKYVSDVSGGGLASYITDETIYVGGSYSKEAFMNGIGYAYDQLPFTNQLDNYVENYDVYTKGNTWSDGVVSGSRDIPIFGDDVITGVQNGVLELPQVLEDAHVLPWDIVTGKELVQDIPMEDAIAKEQEKESEKEEEKESEKEDEKENEKDFNFVMPSNANDITKKFPFCIPFDIIKTFEKLADEEEAPNFDFEYYFEPIDYTFKVEINLEDYKLILEIFKIGEVILFIIGLALVTSKITKWGD